MSEFKKYTPQIIYIMGRGHSGSTILDLLLGNAENVESVGELLSGMGRLDSQCSCGAKIKNCEFWTNVRNFTKKEKNLVDEMNWGDLVKISHYFGHIYRFPRIFFSKMWPMQKIIEKYKLGTIALFNSIAKAAISKVVVDSSKEVTRGLFLALFLPNVRIIHLVRNGEQILASNLWRMKIGEGFKFLRRKWKAKHFHGLFLILSSISWVIGNLLAELVGLCVPDCIIRIHYEDLCEKPEEVLEKIGAFIECDMSSVISAVKNNKLMKIGHNIAGNRIRMRKTFKFNPKSRLHLLPKSYQIFFRIIAMPLILHYGYPSFYKIHK